MKLIVPLAGPHEETYKPFQMVDGEYLITHILKQHTPYVKAADTIFIILKEHEKKYQVTPKLKNLFGPEIIIKTLLKLTRGAPCSILDGAGEYLTDEDILIELADVIRDVSVLYKDISTKASDIAGIIPIQPDTVIDHRPWGYAYLNSNKTVQELKEKQTKTTSALATMWLYYFSRGIDFKDATNQMVRNNSFTYKDAFFVGPVYNELIKK